jgi:nucleotide-binding universal stress UspA family protein
VCGIGHPGDAEPVRVAARLARELRLTLLPTHVVSTEDDATASAAVAQISERWTERLAVRAGEPSQQLAQVAQETHAAMVVVGTRGRGSVRSGLFGSVARELACTSTTPVVVCPEHARSRVRD